MNNEVTKERIGRERGVYAASSLANPPGNNFAIPGKTLKRAEARGLRRSVRIGTPCTAWYRLVPDKFFLREET
jgi:hypothetical protein